jgi:hypothetical protein
MSTTKRSRGLVPAGKATGRAAAAPRSANRYVVETLA